MLLGSIHLDTKPFICLVNQTFEVWKLWCADARTTEKYDIASDQGVDECRRKFRTTIGEAECQNKILSKTEKSKMNNYTLPVSSYTVEQKGALGDNF